jgi:hypothetical protein
MLFTYISGSLLAVEADRVTTSEAINPATRAHSFTVTNNSSVGLTGITVMATRHVSGTSQKMYSWYFRDCLLDPRYTPLSQGQSYTFDVGNEINGAGPVEVSLTAAIFADGVAVGEPQAIKSLWDRRRWLAIGFDEVFHHIDVSVPDKNDREAMVSTLTSIKQSRIGPGLRREERDSLLIAYGTVINNLKSNTSVPPAQLVESLRRVAMARSAAILSQLAPSQIKEP